MTACWRLALHYICCVLSLLGHSVSFLLCTSSCHSSVPASWQWQFSQISCGTCSAVLTLKFELSIFISYCWEIIVTSCRLVWNSTCFSAGIQTLNDESPCDIIEWYTSLGIIKNKLLFFLPEMYSPYSCDLNLYWVGKILSHLPGLCGCDWQNCLKSSYITDRIHLPCHFSIHTKQWSHPEDGGSMFLWNVETSTHCTVHKP